MENLRLLRDKNLGIKPEKPFEIQRTRLASRAVVMSGAKVGLLYSTRDRSYKLPGGGLKPSEVGHEGFRDAMLREGAEELGTNIKIKDELGTVVEQRGKDGLLQISKYFLAKQVGRKRKPKLSPAEKAAGMKVVWAPDLQAAYDLVANPGPKSKAGRFMTARDAMILQDAMNHLTTKKKYKPRHKKSHYSLAQ